ncbi:MAG: 30S ribosomal protein S6 [Elusimicrobiota bacterium]|nr:30S ribosomal protein S6 [Elusimicrobiota bacterium]
MNTYELIIILNPQVSDTEVGEFIEKTKKLISDEKGEVVSEDKLGRRKLSHAINKNRDGFYLFLKMKLEASALKTIKRQLKLQERVLRTMFFKPGKVLVSKK